jgi:hypothetical protein
MKIPHDLKIGDNFYVIEYPGKILTIPIYHIKISGDNEKDLEFVFSSRNGYYKFVETIGSPNHFNRLGEGAFLTKEEAEHNLKIKKIKWDSEKAEKLQEEIKKAKELLEKHKS